MLSWINKRYFVLSLCAVMLATLMLVSCAGGGSNAGSQPVSPESALHLQDVPIFGDPAPGSGNSYPAFPGASGALSVMRSASDAETTLMGNEFTDAEGEGNGPGETDPNGYVIAPGDNDDIAWAIYGIGGFSPDRPLDFQIDVAGVIAPGDNEDLPLSFWIGLSNYSEFAWEWLGPYSSATSLELNSETIRERYVSLADNFYFVVLTDPTGIEPTIANPQGISAVEITSTTTLAVDAMSPEYYPTAPHYPTEPSVGEGGSKGGSTLDPATQYVTLDWTHHIDSISPQNDASGYKVFRRRIGGMDGMTLLNTMDAPTVTFTDPINTRPLVGGPVPGETYAYYVRGINAGGHTSYSHAGRQHIPIYPPTSLRATDGTRTDGIGLDWDMPEGATGIEVFRNSKSNRIAVIGDVTQWGDSGVNNYNDHTYWVRARNAFGSTSPFSAPATGHMNGVPEAVLTIGNGQETGTWPHLVEFDATASLDPDGGLPGNGITNYEWDFDGDGNYDDQTTGGANTFEYDAVFGDFNATVRVTDVDNATATASVMIHINDPPTAELNASPTDGQPGMVVTFDATGSSDQDDGIADYEWDLDGNGVFNDEQNDEDTWRGNPSPVVTYWNFGVFEVMVRITDNTGATDTSVVIIEIWA